VKKLASATDPLWYKDAVIYEIHVRAFADSNADGIGDFQGLISRLDYLQELGVTCLWLLPFFPSPLRDDGYDIANYTAVNPSYGTIEDFQQFLTQAHARNMQVMIELVINHTSDQHPWFQKARRAPKDSPERNMYVWSDTDKLFEGVRIIFTDTEKSNWTWDEVAQQYYWHRFFSHQPDLNFDNPQVMEEVLNAMRFWMDMGVDGLRLDAIPYLIERDGTSCENVPETHVLIKKIRSVIDAEYENRLVLAEANMWPDDVRPYFGDGDECHMAFHFPLMPRIYMALRQEDRLPITDIMAHTPAIPPNCQWGLFLRNHDELTLEMVTDDERDYMNLAYAADSRMRINVGIRRRLAPLLDNNRRRIELLNSLLFSFPGTPIIYYGDEIGMGDNIYLGDRNGVRTPMQWNSDRNAGFSKAVPARLYFPVIMDPIWGYQAINVEAQQSDASSLLHWTRNMIALRKLFQVFGRGTLEFLHPDNRKILAYIRDYQHAATPGNPDADGHCETVLCVANLSRFAQPVALDLSKYAGRQPVEMLGYVPFPPIGQQLYPLTLAPYSFLWLELQEAVIDSSEPILEPAAAEQGPATPPSQPNLFAGIAGGVERKTVEASLPAFIARQRWFGGKSRSIQSAKIATSTPVPNSAAILALIEVAYNEGAAELYQLPLALASGEEAEQLRAHSPQSIVAAIELLNTSGLLYDASASATFRAALLHLIVSSAEVAGAAGAEPAQNQAAVSLVAAHSHAITALTLDGAESRLSSAEQSNTSILYGSQAILKLFRHLRSGENPDVEVTRFLTNVAHFGHIPAHLGDIHLAPESTTIAFLQAFAANQGDGWSWTLEQLAGFYNSVAYSTPPSAAAPSALFSKSNAAPPAAEHLGSYLGAAQLLGQRTAELHLALATPTENAAFAAEAYSLEAVAEDRSRIETQMRLALDTLSSNLSQLSADTRAQAQALMDRRHRIAASLDALNGSAESFGKRIRIHGDYHLGQVLRSEDDFFLVDFEGEPARSLEERRRKQTPLKDVAGMLRSFDYAARSALATAVHQHPEQAATLEAWAAHWTAATTQSFLSGYRQAIAAQPELIPAPPQAEAMLAALLLEKALYELVYELNNRPLWVNIPLYAVLALTRDKV
jgi:maltose alpha-D-glucosyltransferase/alpha-amylase